jgi:hypothetical protein
MFCGHPQKFWHTRWRRLLADEFSFEASNAQHRNAFGAAILSAPEIASSDTTVAAESQGSHTLSMKDDGSRHLSRASPTRDQQSGG